MPGSFGRTGLMGLSLMLVPSFTETRSFAQDQTAAQPAAAASPTFEVASVKVVPRAARGPYGTGGFRIAQHPGHIRYIQAYMWQILTRAFQMQADQFVGPDWVKSEDVPDRFEIVANVRPGATMEEINAMMRNLLKERFHLAYHIERKEFDVYELVVANGGPKLQDAEIPAELPTVMLGPARKPTGADGYPILVPGWPTGVGVSNNGGMYLTMNHFAGFFPVDQRGASFRKDLGMIRFSFRMVTITQLLGALQHATGIAHAVDHTGLQGKYDVKLGFSLGVGRADDDAIEPGPDVFWALEKQLGLKLRKARAPLDVVVVDHVDRTPVEN